MNRDDEGKLEVIYKNRWEGILGVVLGLGDGRASRRRSMGPVAVGCSFRLRLRPEPEPDVSEDE